MRAGGAGNIEILGLRAKIGKWNLLRVIFFAIYAQKTEIAKSTRKEGGNFTRKYSILQKRRVIWGIRNLVFTRKKAETHKSARKKRQIITRKNPIFEIVRVIASEIYAQKTEITKYARKPY